MLPEIWTIVTNTSLFIQNSNPTGSAVCLPGIGPKKHEIAPKFSKPGHLIHTTKLPLIVNSSSRVSPRYTTGGHLWQKLECQVPHQNKKELPRPDLYWPHWITSITKQHKSYPPEQSRKMSKASGPKQESTTILSEINNRFCQQRMDG